MKGNIVRISPATGLLAPRKGGSGTSSHDADETAGRIASEALEPLFEEHLEDFLRNWGPVHWRSQTETIPPTDRPDLALLLHGLSGIEDDAFYMQKKLRHSGAARMQSVKHFNSVWLVEEAEHARALAALSERFGGGAVDRRKHSTFKRDKRSILAVPGLTAASLYGRGITAAYMTLGVLVEYIAITTYNAIPKVFPCEPMADVLRQMSRQEGRHLRFYRSGAGLLLQGDPKAQAFVRYVVTHFWRPPGVDLFGEPAWWEIFAPLMNDRASIARYRRVDGILGSLPGMAGLNPMGVFLDRSPYTLPTAGSEKMTTALAQALVIPSSSPSSTASSSATAPADSGAA
jgi:hypothetical protein